MPSYYLQFQDTDNFGAIIIGIVQLNDTRMMQTAHDFDFSFHISAIFLARYFNIFGGQSQICRFFCTHKYCAECASI